MNLVQTDSPDLQVEDEFTSLVDSLRMDFRRLFPHLGPREHECFFVEQHEDKSSGKVWIEFIKERGGAAVRCRITIIIAGNRPIRRVHEETEPEDELENTSFICP
jgi:hypothetical protein